MNLVFNFWLFGQAFPKLLRKFKNFPLQDFPSEPLRWFALGVFAFQIFEPPRSHAKEQAAEKPLALSSPYPQKKLNISVFP